MLSSIYRAGSTCNLTPNALMTLRIVSNRGFAPGLNALYRLSRPSPVSLAMMAMPLALAIYPNARSN